MLIKDEHVIIGAFVFVALTEYDTLELGVVFKNLKPIGNCIVNVPDVPFNNCALTVTIV